MVQQSILKGDALQKIGSVGFIIAAMLLVIGNLLMPYTTTPTSNIREMLKPLGEQEFRAEVASLLIAAGFWAMMIGATGVSVDHRFAPGADERPRQPSWSTSLDRIRTRIS